MTSDANEALPREGSGGFRRYVVPLRGSVAGIHENDTGTRPHQRIPTARLPVRPREADQKVNS